MFISKSTDRALTVLALQAKAYPDAPIYGGSNRAPALTNLMKDKDEFTLGETLHVKSICSRFHPSFLGS